MLHVDDGCTKKMLGLDAHDGFRQASADCRQPVHIREEPSVVDVGVLGEDLIEPSEVFHIDDGRISVECLMNLLPVSQMCVAETGDGEQKERQPHDDEKFEFDDGRLGEDCWSQTPTKLRKAAALQVNKSVPAVVHAMIECRTHKGLSKVL